MPGRSKLCNMRMTNSPHSLNQNEYEKDDKEENVGSPEQRGKGHLDRAVQASEAGPTKPGDFLLVRCERHRSHRGLVERDVQTAFILASTRMKKTQGNVTVEHAGADFWWICKSNEEAGAILTLTRDELDDLSILLSGHKCDFI